MPSFKTAALLLTLTLTSLPALAEEGPPAAPKPAGPAAVEAWAPLALEGGPVRLFAALGKTLFAGDATLFRSTDEARSWSGLKTPPPGKLDALVSDGARLWASVEGTRLFSSPDGEGWSEVAFCAATFTASGEADAPAKCAIVGLAAANKRLLVEATHGLFELKADKWSRLDDGSNFGSNFTFDGPAILRGSKTSGVVVRTAAKQRSLLGTPLLLAHQIVALGKTLMVRGEIGGYQGLDSEMACSADAGKSWKLCPGPQGEVPTALLVDGKRILGATSNAIFESPDGGRSWKKVVATPFTATSMLRMGAALVIAGEGVARVDLGTKAVALGRGYRNLSTAARIVPAADGVLVQSGLSWQRCSAQGCEPLADGFFYLWGAQDGALFWHTRGDAELAAMDAEDQEQAKAAAAAGDWLRVSLDGGASWRPAQALEMAPELSFGAGGRHGAYLFLGFSELFASADGVQWEQRATLGSLENAVVSAAGEQVAIGIPGGSKVVVSSDGGREFTRLKGEAKEVRALDFAGQGLLVVTANGILRSPRGPAGWGALEVVTPLAGNEKAEAAVVRGEQIWIASASGVRSSRDGGSTWQQLGSPAGRVRQLTLGKDGLYARWEDGELSGVSRLPFDELPETQAEPR